MLIEYLHQAVSWLLHPVIIALMIVSAAAIWELGMAIGERFGGLQRLRETAAPRHVEQVGRKRIERVDLIARIAPMLGLMGTLIPLGPGLAALGQGNVALLADAVTVAFDTTVLGLFGGVLGFLLARVRRRWYDQLLDQMEAQP